MTGLAILALLAMSSGQRDAVSVARYLDEPRVREVIDSAGLVAWQACLDGGGELPRDGLGVWIVIDPDGRVRQVGSEQDAPACFLDAARGLVFPAHDDDALTVRFTLAQAVGRVVSPYSVHLDARPLAPLYLYIPPELAPDSRLAVLRALGLEPPLETPAVPEDAPPASSAPLSTAPSAQTP